MAVPDDVKRLIEQFDKNADSYRSKNYNETRLRVEFLDPFFKALGWDVHNEKGYAEAYKEVIHEDAINVGGATKAPDYCFRIGSERKFFLEAKKPAVNIKEDISPAYQLRRYAWSAKLPLSVLSDFDEFATYDCRVKPIEGDKPSTARILYIAYREYEDRWEEIYSVFSREAVLTGSFDQYAETTKKKKGTAEVDDAFLSDIEAWRDVLARNLALRNPSLSQRELNYSVQVTIDRIIFLRICEDRGIETYGQLLALTNGAGIYSRLLQLFQRADDRYNSGLFHFQNEKGRIEAPDTLTPHLAIDDKVLVNIIKSLYYPNSPYEFSVLPATILGQVYEQFLGKVIRLTAGHQAKVEDKPEVKKAGGVYYTPDYIVEYIVDHTVGKLLEGKTPKQAAKLKILDPACGSGSFLIGAYQKLLDWHYDWYLENEPEKRKEVYQGRGGEWKLTVAERKRILLNNIYGVDIDPQAVEVTKLSLLLKVLEGESEESLTSQMQLFQERALPDLSNNIKCGNSLVGPDFYSEKQMSIADDEERWRVNAFDWEGEFREIFAGTNPGFDAVIGNPPYVRQETLGEMKKYFSSRYTTYHGIADLYVYFIERGVSLLKQDGVFSYIVSNKWMRANYGEPLRNWMKKQRLEEIVDFGDLSVFQKLTTYPCILRIRRNRLGDHFGVTQVKTLGFLDLGEYVEENRYEIDKSSLDDKGWSLADERTSALLAKLYAKGVPLSEYVGGKIYYGIKTGLNEAFVIDVKTRDQLIEKDPKSVELIRPFLVGRDIKRYRQPSSNRYLIFIPKGWTNRQGASRNAWKWLQEKFPSVAEHLAPFAGRAEARYDQGEYWWELRACDYYEEFEKPKIIWPGISSEVASFAFDQNNYYGNDNTQMIVCDDKYLFGILNSRLMKLYLMSLCDKVQGGFYRLKITYIQQMPIFMPSTEDTTASMICSKVNYLAGILPELNNKYLKARTNQEKAALQRQIDATDRQIDQLVYELYELTPDEIKIVEEATNI